MPKPNMLELPVGAELVYLAEGGANIIYRILFSTQTHKGRNPKDVPITVSSNLPSGVTNRYSIPASFKGKLLRLRKDTSSGIPYEEIARNFDQCIRPLFKPEDLVDQELVCLPRGLVQLCNEQLLAAEQTGQRPRRRQGVYLSTTETFGLLITDMTTFASPGTTLSELKPKWLAQSPSAPANSRRCRTCALREMKNHKARKTGKSEETSFCPLDLVSDRFENVFRAARFVKGCKDQARLAKVLYRNSTLQKLLAHQKSMCDVGLHGPPVTSVEKSLGMTLRDCTMFIRIPKDETSRIEVRLGDLDLKTGAGGKAKYWLDLELRLNDEGWYMGARSSVSENECALQGPRNHSQPSI
ncbi:inositol-pentakisphosphate 2-kinase [Aspergillus brunneoviolaceus CBS 621.78]|uniref:Inositol-pentakisphosphate 2-kinase n=1 Tax=Aspergillus brunneoviolaceus CBS 621.78 TaxID=1450534 RepID=A0ACD1GQK6_9EURO|nr:inositol-pentakisphosphate 2-kinase [Aspergillus brunneoviolaceus CBS 621.78]RAH51564.1 inositol-pentakisphosphate 2-kinase [Aspergillus brunneoviolaceus CBS 621.78]